MTYHGHQFRAARAVTGMSTRAVCAAASMSMRTLAAVEAAGAIAYGHKQAGRHDEATVAKLVAMYEEAGVRFLPERGHEAAGLRYAPPHPDPRA